MLNRAKVVRELAGASERLFIDYSQEYQEARDQFARCASDPTLLERINAHPSFELVTWKGNLLDTQKVSAFKDPYHIVAVDGSQVYPDKHQGTSCYLINVGSVVFRYQDPHASSHFGSEPFLFVPEAHSDFEEQEQYQAVDLVDGKREELELLHGLLASSRCLQEAPDLPLLLIFDGSLLFWHLEAKDAGLRDHFLHRYCMVLEQLYQKRIPVIGYMSLSKHRDLVRIVRAYTAHFDQALLTKKRLFTHTSDLSLIENLLPEGHISELFRINSSLSLLYPSHLRPWFCYYMTSDELVRLEFPQYLAQDKDALMTAIALVVDQLEKGNGYPISIAEAHAQAVVKGADRLFFYHVLEKQSIEQKKRMIMSQKNRKKRRMSI